MLTDLQLGREGEKRDGTIRRVGADALEAMVLADLRRLADRPGLGANDVTVLLKRLELRSQDTHLALDRVALVGDDHLELAPEDLRARLGEGERLVVEPGGHAPRIALPRRMQLRGGRTWITAGAVAAVTAIKPDLVLVHALRCAARTAWPPTTRRESAPSTSAACAGSPFLSSELQTITSPTTASGCGPP